jgi:hypothetical protein
MTEKSRSATAGGSNPRGAPPEPLEGPAENRYRKDPRYALVLLSGKDAVMLGDRISRSFPEIVKTVKKRYQPKDIQISQDSVRLLIMNRVRTVRFQ